MGKYSIRKSLVWLCGSACLCAAALLLALVLSPVKVYAADHGDWGDCTWTITTEKDGSKTMTLEGKAAWADAGYKSSRPWMDSSNREDFKDLTKMVIGTEQNPVTINKGDENSSETSNSLNFLFSGLDTVTHIDMTWADTTGCDNMSYMFDNCKALTNLTLGEHFNTSSVKRMASMFYDCNALKQLDLSRFDTSNVSDMSLMFYGCKAIEKLDLTDFKTDKLTAICSDTMGGLFDGCESLTTLLLPEPFNTSAIKEFSYMFSGCKKLTELDVSKFNTTSAEDMRGMFSGCSALESMDVSSFDTSGVTHMGDMFSGCSALESIDVSSFDTSEVTHMASMFRDCSSLKSVDLSNFDVSNIDSMYAMFKGCEKLTEVTMPRSKQGAEKQIKNLNELFAGCKSLTEVDMSGLDTKKVECAAKMFENCSSLATLSCDLSFFQNIKTVRTEYSEYDTFIYAFTGCNSLKELPASLKLSEEICTLAVTGDDIAYDSCPMFDFGDNVPSSPVVTRYKGSDPNVIKYPWKKDGRVLDITSLEDGKAAIKIQKGGQDIAVDASVNEGDVLTYVLGSEKMKEALSGKDIKTLTPTWQRKTAKDSEFVNIAEATGAEYTVTAKDSGAKLRVVLTGSGNLCGELASSEVQVNQQGTWGKCTWKITDEGSEKVLTVLGKTDGAEAGTVDSAPWKSAGGADMTGVTKIVVGVEEKAVMLTEAESLFMGLDVQTIEMNSVKTKVPDQTASLSMEGMFRNCKSLERLDLSGLDAGGVTNMNGMFNGCNALTTLTLSETFNTSNVTIMSSMFNGCKALTILTLPESFNVSNVTSMANMFYKCNALKTLTLPKTFDTSRVRDMTMMFNGCSALTTLTLPETFDTSNVGFMRSMFSGCNALKTLTLPDVFDTSEVGDMLRMFYDCPALTEIPSTFILPPNAVKLDVFGFSADNKPEDPVVTTYAGSDAEMISYDWAGDNRRLDIRSLADGSNKASVKLQVDGEDVNGPVQKGTVLEYVLGPEKIKKALSGADINIKTLTTTWQRKAAGATEFVNITGAVGTEYTVTAADAGAELRVVLTGNDNLCRELVSSKAQISKMTPAADDFAVTLPGTGSEHTKEYDGVQATASVSPSEGITGLGDITVWYERLKDNGNYDTAVKDAPKDAGTYRVTYTAAEGSRYLNTETPLEAGTFTITPRILSADVGVPADALSTTVDVKEAEGVTVPLEGGNIISGDKVSATGCSVTYPSASTVGAYTDGTVTAEGLDNPNYALPEEGLTLSDQAYSVEDRTLTGLTVTSAPAKTSYIEGETFIPDGMMVEAAYDNGSTKDVTGSVTWTPVGALTPSDTAVTVSYQEGTVTQTADITISVSARSYTIAALPETLDFGTVQENYEKPQEQTVTISNTGNQTVQLTLTGNENFDSRLSASTLGAGESVTLTVSPKAGLAKGTYDTKLTVSTAHETAVEVEVAFTVREPEPVVYPVLSVGPDNSGAWTKGEGSLPIRIDAVFSLFAHQVTVDKVTLEEEVDYRAESGSTVIILEQTYLDTLEAGKHTMRVAFENGYSETEFEIKGGSSPAGEEKPQGDAQQSAGTDGSKKAAATGDTEAPGVYAALLVMAGAALIGAGAVRRRRKMREQER